MTPPVNRRPGGCAICRDLDPAPPRCLHCGATRADRARAALGGTSIADAPGPTDLDRAERTLEFRLRLIAPPVAFAVAFLVMGSPLGRMLSRIFLSMWIHELGHATAAWMCGFAATPGPWRTSVSDERHPIAALVFAAAIAAGAYVAHRADRRVLAAALAALVATQLFATFVLRPDTGRMLFTFFGDGGMLVLGGALTATFYVPPGSYLHRGMLRWGFLVIGAVAFADAAVTWWAARRDLDAIAFGENEGSGPSDPTVLVDTFGWGMREMVSRYVTLTVVCALALAALWAWQVWRSRPAASAD